MSDLYRRFPDNNFHDDPHKEPDDPHRSRFMLPLANVVSSLLPSLGVPAPAMAGTLRTYAPWPVWRDTTTKTVKFMPLKKKQAVKIFHKARAFERQTRQKANKTARSAATACWCCIR